jgi:hypothetical protein
MKMRLLDENDNVTIVVEIKPLLASTTGDHVMNTWIATALARHTVPIMVVAAAALATSLELASAPVIATAASVSTHEDHDNPVNANEYPRPEFYLNHAPCTSLDDCDRKAYGESGTRGRMGLGADPAHPEGPGNPSL